jgi:hypothetical protein
VGLKTIGLYVIAGSALVGSLGRPPADPAGAIDIGGPCPPATRQWAKMWGQRQNRDEAVLRVSVLCRADGTTYAASILSSRPAQGRRRASWHPLTTFFETLSPPGRERVDIFDQTGRLVEYATVDRQSGRIEFYNAASRLTGEGRFDVSTGRVERFGLDAHGETSLVLPIPPGVADEG